MQDNADVEADHPAVVFFFGLGYLQHACADWNGSLSCGYHLYIIPNSKNLGNAIYFAYIDS